MATTSFDAAVPSREDETMMPPPSPKLEDHDQAGNIVSYTHTHTHAHMQAGI